MASDPRISHTSLISPAASFVDTLSFVCNLSQVSSPCNSEKLSLIGSPEPSDSRQGQISRENSSKGEKNRKGEQEMEESDVFLLESEEDINRNRKDRLAKFRCRMPKCDFSTENEVLFDIHVNYHKKKASKLLNSGYFNSYYHAW